MTVGGDAVSRPGSGSEASGPSGPGVDGPEAGARNAPGVSLASGRERRGARRFLRGPRPYLVVAVVVALVAAGFVTLGRHAGAGGKATPAQVRSALKGFVVKPLDLATIATHPVSTTAAGGGTAVAAAVPTGVGGSSATATLPPSSGATVAAPPGFRQQLDALYLQITDVNASISTGVPGPSGSGATESPAQFDRAVAAIPLQQLDVLYSATAKTPGWAGVPAAYDRIAANVAAGSGPAVRTPAAGPGTAGPAASIAPSARVSGAGGSGASVYPYPNSSTTTTFTPASVPPYVPVACPPGAPGGDYGEDSIYAAQLAIDAFTGANSIIPQELVIGFEAAGEGDTSTLPDPAWIVVQALLGAAEVTHDTLAWRQAIANDCGNANNITQMQAVDSNVDYLTGLVDSRTTALENEAEAIYALVDTRTTLILNQLAVLQATVNLQIKVVISQDLLQGATGAVAELEQPASQGGYLDAVPIGVQGIVTAALAAMQQSGEAVNPAAPQSLASANAALAAHQYKSAFNLYSQAYQEIVQ